MQPFKTSLGLLRKKSGFFPSEQSLKWIEFLEIVSLVMSVSSRYVGLNYLEKGSNSFGSVIFLT